MQDLCIDCTKADEYLLSARYYFYRIVACETIIKMKITSAPSFLCAEI